MKSTICAFVIIILCIIGGVKADAQTAMPYKSTYTRTAKDSVQNWQGFKLPASCNKTDTVFSSSKGTKFVFKTSKNTGKRYRYYLTSK